MIGGGNHSVGGLVFVGSDVWEAIDGVAGIVGGETDRSGGVDGWGSGEESEIICRICKKRINIKRVNILQAICFIIRKNIVSTRIPQPRHAS
jgi:hypothetical protein